jgi:hypothetical protein
VDINRRYPEGMHPEPLGQIIPDLAHSYNYNSDTTPSWLRFYCPSCSSDNVCYLHPDYDYGGRWFCITCHSSWIYERDEE